MKRNTAIWALYDFANSIVMMAFLFYFSQWLVIDRGMPAWWYNGALIISSVLFILTAPSISRRIDATGKKIQGLRWWSILSFTAFIAIALITMLASDGELIATILYTIAMYAYLVCFLYFTPMLDELSSEGNRSWISGIGQGANSFGQVVGILITIPFVNGITLFGDPGRAQTLLPAVIIFALLALPMLILYRDTPQETIENVSTPSRSPWKLLREVFGIRNLALLFIAYFLISDALLTFANNFPLYLETVHGVSDTIKSLLTASILILASIGALVFGKIADKFGSAKTLRIIIGIWCVLFIAMALISNFVVLVPIFLVAGIFFGPVWGISRSMVGEYAPRHLAASSYSYYVVAERFSTLVGPLVWSIALVSLGENPAGYKLGLLLLGGLMIIGLSVLRFMKAKIVI